MPRAYRISPEVASLSRRVNSLHRWSDDPAKLAEAEEALAKAKTVDSIRRAVEAAPPLDSETRDLLVSIVKSA